MVFTSFATAHGLDYLSMRPCQFNLLKFVCCTADTHTSQFLIKGCDFRSKRDNVLQIFKFHSNTIISALFTHCSPIDQICIVAEECRFVPRWCETNALGVRLIQFTN